MKILDIQKNLLITHLGLRGINEELLDTFPIQNLVDKSDDQVCVIFNIHFKELELKSLTTVLDLLSKTLEIDPSSIEKKDKNTLSVQVFYDSLSMHWSDKASLKFDELAPKLSSMNAWLTTNVSINN